MAKIQERLKDPNNKDIARIGDISDFLLEVTFGNLVSLSSLIGYGVIPARRVAVHMAESTLGAYKFNVSLVFHHLNLPNPPVIGLSSAELQKFLTETAKENPNLSHTMLVEMYRVNGFAAAALGGLSASMISLTNALLVDTSTKVDGLKLWNNYRVGAHMKVLEDLMTLENAVTGGKSALAQDQLTAMKSHFEKLKANTEILAEMKANPARAAELRQKIQVIADPAKLGNILPRGFGTQAGIAVELEQTLYRLSKHQEALAHGDLLKRFQTLFASMQIMKMPRMVDKVLLHFPNVESAQATLKQISSFGPEIASSFFRAIPVA